MHRIAPLAMALGLTLTVTSSAIGLDSPPTATENHAPAKVAMLAIADALEQEKADLELLMAEFRQSSDSATALAVQKRIQQRKAATEIRIVQIQLDLARGEGRHEDAQRLSKALAHLTERQARNTSSDAKETDQ